MTSATVIAGPERVTDPDRLRAAQAETLAQDRMRSGLGARVLFAIMDLLYGRGATLAKSHILEVVARVPYQAWEQISYVAITHTHRTPEFARTIQERVQEARAQQDNEFWHLLILEELIHARGDQLSRFRHRIIPQVLAWGYYHLSWALYVVKPRWSYALNAQFEDHAEHEYMGFVRDHPELDTESWVTIFADDYGEYGSVGDLLKRIGLDERHHKIESMERIETARFS
jgi:ubiquinol oxidase